MAIRLMLVLIAVILACQITIAKSSSISGNRVLVILDTLEDANTKYSIFLEGLRGKSFRCDSRFLVTDISKERELELTLKEATAKYELTLFEERLYDHLIVLSPSGSDYHDEITTHNLIDFINKGGNILVATSSNIAEVIKDFAIEFSVDFDDQATKVYDISNSFSGEGDSVPVFSSNFGTKAKSIITAGGVSVKDKISLGPVLFDGVAHRLTRKNSLIVPVLSGPPTAYSLDLNDEGLIVNPESPFVGSSIVYVSALQARNNARVVFSGSALLFSDKFANAKINIGNSEVQSGNAEFVKEVGKWLLQEKRVLEVKSFSHHLENQKLQKKIYRIQDNVEVEVTISEFYNMAWHPFIADDLQIEAVMLDPYIRKTMVPLKNNSDKTSAAYVAKFKLSDQYGVFKYRLEYKRHGFSWISVEDTVEVRPFRHNEFPRFLTAAYPYYINAFSIFFGFLVISIFWLFHHDDPKKQTKLKTQ